MPAGCSEYDSNQETWTRLSGILFMDNSTKEELVSPIFHDYVNKQNFFKETIGSDTTDFPQRERTMTLRCVIIILLPLRLSLRVDDFLEAAPRVRGGAGWCHF